MELNDVQQQGILIVWRLVGRFMALFIVLILFLVAAAIAMPIIRNNEQPHYVYRTHTVYVPLLAGLHNGQHYG